MFVSMTGGVTRYVYDAQGRMTEWYDAAGIRQVMNTYDKDDRAPPPTGWDRGRFLDWDRGRFLVPE